MTSVSTLNRWVKVDRPLMAAGSARAGAWYGKYRNTLLISDALLIVVAVAITHFTRFGDDVAVQVGDTDLTYLAAGALIGTLWLGVLDAVESRSRKVLGAGLEEYRRVINSGLITFGTVAIASYLAQVPLSRLFFVTTLPLGVALLLAGRWSLRGGLNLMRRDSRALTPVVIVGQPEHIRDAARDMLRHPEAGFRPSAACLFGDEAGSEASALGEDVHGLPRIDFPLLQDGVRSGRFAAVAVAGGLSREDVRRLSWSLENAPVELLFVPQLTDVAGPRISVRPVEGLGLLQVDLPRYSGWNHLIKRVFDVVFSGVALVLLSPMLLAVALAIKLDDGGPILFRQQRVGLGGKPFIIHKFRTMSVDAESKIGELIEASGGKALLFKIENDPRITRIGATLRKYSLDELPQFWTVLRGQMSVVGPRPQVAREVAEYSGATHRRLLTKPGITGLWQVNGRSELSVEESIRLDLRYVENWSLTGDLAIILKTVRVVLVPNGAY